MSILKQNKNEIIWNLVNSTLAGALVFAGACADGNLTWKGIGLALIAGVIVMITKFNEYWAGEQKEYSRKLFNFF